MAERILITGGSGFLGRALGAKFRKKGHRVLLASRSQSPLLDAKNATNCEIKPLDVASEQSVEDLFCFFKPSVIIHAAASKHVGLAELEPLECIDINVRGSQNIARAAIRHQSQTVIGVSTDKAAAPALTTYGMSKALMERCFCALHGTGKTNFSIVRLGNLAWSSGSVFPLWYEMHSNSGNIQSTGPRMKRYFMSRAEAVKIISDMLNRNDVLGGKILVPDLKAAQMVQVLDVWTRLFGGTWQEIDARTGDSEEQNLIGKDELVFTEPFSHSERQCYLVDLFNTAKKTGPLKELSTETAQLLTEHEILELLQDAAAPDLTIFASD